MTMLRRLSILVIFTAGVVGIGIVTPAQPAAASAWPTELTIHLSHTELRRGEGLWISGKLTREGRAMGSRSVIVQSRTDAVGWRDLATVTTRADGTWTYPTIPVGDVRYRAVFHGTPSFQPAHTMSISFRYEIGQRTLEQRAAQLGSNRLGAPLTGVRSHSNVSGYAVRWRTYESGTLVERKQGTNVRTWFVIGELDRVYRANGGPTGTLGIPINDALCGLMERGCLQRFTKGALYTSPVAQQTGMSTDRTRRASLIATARSEVGYKAPSNNISRYNRWIGTNNAWCSIFLSWTAVASGYDSMFPVHGNFTAFHDEARRSGRIGTTPQIGAIAFYDTHLYDGRTAATHAGLVSSFTASTVTTIEGNTSAPGGGRGTHEKTRSRSMPLYYYYPPY